MDLTNFDVGNIEKMKNSSINEGNEFGPNSNATRSVDNGTPDANVSVPGGVKETPSSKPYDQHSVNVPGDSAVPGTNVPIPGKITLTSSEYNQALDMLQKSFKESYDGIAILKTATVISDSDAYDQNIVESAIDDALLSALENGPLFEAVDRSDKKEVKRIVSEIRKDIKKACENEGVSFYKPALVARLLTTLIPAAAALTPAGAARGVAIVAGTAMSGATISSWQQVFTTRLWQVLGICHIESGNVTALQNALTEKFKEQLGDYKILLVRTTPSLHDAFKVKFNWKNNKGTYFMLVDKKLDSEIKKIISNIKPEEGNKGENNEVKTESFKEGSNMNLNELYAEYIMDFTESGTSGKPLTIDEFEEAVDEYMENGDIEEFMENKATREYNNATGSSLSNKEYAAKKKNLKDNPVKYDFVKKMYKAYRRDYKSAKKANGKASVGKAMSRPAFIANMIAMLEDEAAGGSVTSWNSNKFERVEGEVVFTIPQPKKKQVRKMINDCIEQNVTPTDAIADKAMECFDLVVLESYDTSEVFEHLDDFLAENCDYDDYDDYEEGVNKDFKNVARRAAAEDGITDKKAVKAVIRDARSAVNDAYRQYRSECKACGERPMNKSDFKRQVIAEFND